MLGIDAKYYNTITKLRHSVKWRIKLNPKYIVTGPGSLIYNLVLNGRVKWAIKLIDVGVKVDVSVDDTTVLDWAVYHGSMSLVSKLLDNNIDLKHSENFYGYPLHCAVKARENNVQLIGLLLGKGADVKALNDENNTPLKLALSCAEPDVAVVRRLCEGGATVGMSANDFYKYVEPIIIDYVDSIIKSRIQGFVEKKERYESMGGVLDVLFEAAANTTMQNNVSTTVSNTEKADFVLSCGTKLWSLIFCRSDIDDWNEDIRDSIFDELFAKLQLAFPNNNFSCASMLASEDLSASSSAITEEGEPLTNVEQVVCDVIQCQSFDIEKVLCRDR